MSTPGGFDPRHDPTAPSSEPPSYDSPSYDSPSYDSPSYDSPSYDSPSYEPAYEPPSYGPPSYGAPTYGPPDAAPPETGEPAVPSYEPSGYDPSAYPPPGSTPYPPPDGPTSAAYPAPGGYAPAQPGSAYGSPAFGGPGQPGPRRRSAGAVWALVVGVLVVLALGATGVFFLVRSGDDNPVAGPTPTRSPAPTTSAPRTSGSPTGATSSPSSSSSPSATSSGAAEVMVPAVTPGFQGVLSPKENVAYDVPTGWKVQTPSTLVGFEDGSGNPLAVIHGVSTYRPDACPDVRGSNRGNAGFKTAGTVDPAQAVQDGVKVFSEAAALNDDGSSAPVTPGPVVDVTVGQGAIAAKMTTATVTPPAGASCGAPSVVFTGVAFTTPSGATALFIMYLDQGTSDALPADQAQQIVASLRPYTG